MLLWWLIVELVGLLALPVAFVLLKNLPDKGYALGKPLGILILGYTLWLAATFHILPNTRPFIALLLVLLGALGLYLAWRQRGQLITFLRERWPVVLASEAVFTGLFLLWALVRSHNPEISITEQPMDFAFLNASIRSEYFPPRDPWLSGFSVSYYYFGYLMMAALTQLSGLPSAVAYNLSLAMLFGLTGAGAFSLVYNLVSRNHKSLTVPLAFGLLGTLFILLIGNLEGALEFFHSHGFGDQAFWQSVGIKDLAKPYVAESWAPTDFWWWWRATRVIDTVVGGRSLDYTITEFPFFSFMLGDMHPHVMSLPFVLLALGLSLNVFLSEDRLGPEWIVGHPLQFLVTAVALGGLGFLNSWDFPTFTLIFILALGLRLYWQREALDRRFLQSWLLFAGALGMLSVLLYLPFYLSFRSQVSGVLPVMGAASKPVHFLIVWGFFLFVVVSLVLLRYVGLGRGRGFSPKERDWIVYPLIAPLALWSVIELAVSLEGEKGLIGGLASVVAKAVGLVPWLVVLGITAFIIWRTMQGCRDEARRAEVFPLMLVFVGLLLTMGTELFFIKDVFGNRMNTVFKFYYQAWVLLGIASAYGVYRVSSLRPTTALGRGAGWAWRGAFMVLLLASAYYPLAASYTKAGGFKSEPTLDGLAHIRKNNASEYEAVHWLWTNVPGSPTILEAVGGSYSEYARIAGRTGIPTVLGWPGHEAQWRGSDRYFRGREQDVAAIYQGTDVNSTRSLLQKYNVDYIYLGPLERTKYGQVPLERFAAFGEVAYQNGEVTIIRVNG